MAAILTAEGTGGKFLDISTSSLRKLENKGWFRQRGIDGIDGDRT